jgi:hypothetical protein
MTQWLILFAGLILVALAASADGADAQRLRLVPFPKEVQLRQGAFRIDRPLVLTAPIDQANVIGSLLNAELARARVANPLAVRAIKTDRFFAALSPGDAQFPAAAKFRQGAGHEDYELRIEPGLVVIESPARDGLLHGVQTLCQLIRANRSPNGIPCLSIRDWPSLKWRCFQDDLTRGPSSKLTTLKYEAAMGSYLKLNLFTYYMEYQFAFQKHPLIGPGNGSISAADLKELVEAARPLGVQILGNQQSFGHFAAILRHQQYANLRENGNVLTPAREETYKLLDDLYSEVCPVLPFEMFNVCCDETYGIGEGPAKEMVKKIGVAGVYVGHIRRIHDLLKEKYGKRMMMWGDIILAHPDHLNQIPRDTVMLTWGYDARASFEKDILPFARSGYEFFVCPGISNWSRILPDFGVANTNIRNYVRDGAKNGAIGMLNTSWEDDGEALKGVIWYGHAWGAECAWNASSTDLSAFNRRLGAVLFGENADHFGRAIELLASTHRMPGMQGMNNRRFWQDDFITAKPQEAQKQAKDLLDAVRPAIAELEACRTEATINMHLLDAYLHGARRMELIGQRMLDGVEVSKLYAEAANAPKDKALELIDKAIALVERNRDAHAALGKDFSRLWLEDCRPYALDWTMQRYTAKVRRFGDLATKLKEARKLVQDGKGLPGAVTMGRGSGRS